MAQPKISSSLVPLKFSVRFGLDLRVAIFLRSANKREVSSHDLKCGVGDAKKYME